MNEVISGHTSNLGPSKATAEDTTVPVGFLRRDLTTLIAQCRDSDSTHRPTAYSLHSNLSRLSKLLGDPRPVSVHRDSSSESETAESIALRALASEINEPEGSGPEKALELLTEAVETELSSEPHVIVEPDGPDLPTELREIAEPEGAEPLFEAVETSDLPTVPSEIVEPEVSGHLTEAVETTDLPTVPSEIVEPEVSGHLTEAVETTDFPTEPHVIVEPEGSCPPKAVAIADLPTVLREIVEPEVSGHLTEAVETTDLPTVPSEIVEPEGSRHLLPTEPHMIVEPEGSEPPDVEIAHLPTILREIVEPEGSGHLTEAFETTDLPTVLREIVEPEGSEPSTEAVETTDLPTVLREIVEPEGSGLLTEAVEIAGLPTEPHVTVEPEGSGLLTEAVETADLPTLAREIIGLQGAGADFLVPLSSSTPCSLQAAFSKAGKCASEGRYDDALRLYENCYEAMRWMPELGEHHADTLKVHSKLLLMKARRVSSSAVTPRGSFEGRCESSVNLDHQQTPAIASVR